jgi:hypothetical protein
MLSTLDLFDLKVRARDGEIGSVRDLTFSDDDWTVRDLEIDTGAWIFGRRVRIDPDVVLDAENLAGTLELALTRTEVKALPDASTDAEILRWHESQTMVQVPQTILGGASVPSEPLPGTGPDAHLRNLRELLGYTISCNSEPVGQLAGFLIDTVAWDLPLALVRLTGDETVVLLPTHLISALSWPQRSIQTTLEASRLKSAPAYDPRIQDERVFLPVVTDYYAARSPAA